MEGNRNEMNESNRGQYLNDYALLVDYLILQDRVMTALFVFKQFVCEEREGRFVPRADCVCNVQVDSMIAYFDCFTESLTQTREICARYNPIQLCTGEIYSATFLQW